MASEAEGNISFSSQHVLCVKRVPDNLDPDCVRRLFGHFGATNTYKRRNAVFVVFVSEAEAKRAKAQLHRVRLLDKVLSVEHVRISDPALPRIPPIPASQPAPPHPTTTPPPPPEEPVAAHAVVGEAIAPGLGVDYPFPPHLQYAYPPPDESIIRNISNTLIAVPRFYMQVLHLMNKMSLPVPFCPPQPTPPLPPHPPPPPPPEAPPLPLPTTSSDSESELDDSDQERRTPMPRKKRRKVGKADLEPPTLESAGVKAVHLSADGNTVIKKKQSIIQIKLGPPKAPPPTLPQSAVAPAGTSEGGGDDLAGQRATRDEITGGRLSLQEVMGDAKFKNYSRGDPSPVLYVKNLLKGVTEEKLLYIFGAFFESWEETKRLVGVKLMQEGRMKGQAFVTFPSIQLAHEALDHVNGFVLEGKPMVVQFGKQGGGSRGDKP